MSGLGPTAGYPTAGPDALLDSGSDTNIAPLSGSLAFTGYAPGISQPLTIEPASGALSFTGYAPTVDQSAVGTVIAPLAGSLTFTGYAPGITQPRTLAAVSGALSFTGYAPSISQRARQEFVQASFDLPSNTPVMDAEVTNRQWLQWFDRIHAIAEAQQQAGITADRPVKRLWLGRQYFDTDLGYVVYVQSVNPTVWVDATGSPV